MPAVAGHVVAGDGTAIGYDASGEGESLLLVHGAAGDARQWTRLVPVLAERFTVFTMERRGRGRSGPQREDVSLASESADVAAVAAGLPAPVHLFGHSSGARYALHAALALTGLASLMLYEPPAPENVTDEVLETLRRQAAARDREGILRTFLIDVLDNDEESFIGLQRRPVWPVMVENALTLPAEMAAARDYRFDPVPFAGLAVPTLLLLGEESGDELVGVIEQLARVLPDSTKVTLAGQGHGAMFSAPELLAAEITRFVDGLGR